MSIGKNTQEKIVKLTSLGHSYHAVGKELNVSPTMVRRYAVLHGVEPYKWVCNFIRELFWSNVEVLSSSDACWLWRGRLSKGGYCLFSRQRMVTNSLSRAHRFSWSLHSGKPVPKGLPVLHSCTNHSCMNPSHLRIGVHDAQMEECQEKATLWQKLDINLHPS